MTYKLTVANYDRQASFKRDLLLCRCSLLTLPDRNMPMEAECLLSCELHSRSLAVGRTGKVHRLLTHVTQSLDCAHVLCNLQNACSISGFWECTTQSRDCANSQIARNRYGVLFLWSCMVLFSLLTKLKVRPRDLQLCLETSSGVDTSGHYQLGDLVQLEWVTNTCAHAHTHRSACISKD